MFTEQASVYWVVVTALFIAIAVTGLAWCAIESHNWAKKRKKEEKHCAVKGCKKEARIVSIPLGGVWLCDKHFSEYKFEGKKLDFDYPICRRLKCGCYIEIWEDTQRTDFCKKHAKEKEIERLKNIPLNKLTDEEFKVLSDYMADQLTEKERGES